MRVMLSVDVDFWYRKNLPALDTFMQQVIQLQVPVVFAEEHHELLWLFNYCDYDTLINVDYHSDIGEGFPGSAEMNMPECGSWGNFIREAHKKDFIWIYPCQKATWPRKTDTSGLCHARMSPFRARDTVKLCGWKSVRQHNKNYKIPWSKVIAVGICHSIEYVSTIELSERFYHWKHLILTQQRKLGRRRLYAKAILQRQ